MLPETPLSFPSGSRQTVLPPSREPKLPTMYDLPYENPLTDGMPDRFHLIQPQLLSETFVPPTCPAEQVLVASDFYVYYDVEHPLWYKRPDWFAVLGVAREPTQQELRLSYVMWQEKVAPYLIVELLSPGTEKEDLGQSRATKKPKLSTRARPPSKWQVYEQILQVPYYLVYGRYTNNLQAFQLVNGHYQEMTVTSAGVWLPATNLGIGLWSGCYQGVAGLWLRFRDAQGRWIPTEMEQRQAAVQQAAVEAQARSKAEQWATSETQARVEAEQRAQQSAQQAAAEAQARVEAEQRAIQEAQARAKAEQRAASLEEELAQLRTLLEAKK